MRCRERLRSALISRRSAAQSDLAATTLFAALVAILTADNRFGALSSRGRCFARRQAGAASSPSAGLDLRGFGALGVSARDLSLGAGTVEANAQAEECDGDWRASPLPARPPGIGAKRVPGRLPNAAHVEPWLQA